MIKKTLICIALIMSMATMGIISYRTGVDQAPNVQTDAGEVSPMPVVDQDVFKYLCAGGIPIEQRGEQVARWLSTGLKIQVSNGSGSGTIVYFDPTDGYAYVQSCGHLWGGTMTAEQGIKKNVTCKVITWYHNEKKLSQPKSYLAHVLYYSNVSGQDCSLLRFKPDWAPDYQPIAPANFQFKVGTYYHSVGCDSGGEVAHYNVRFIGMQGGGFQSVTTTENSPRPGRSGGGLMTDDYYIGVCVATTDTLGRGNGFFTTLASVRDCNVKNGYKWLNEVDIRWAQKLPIIDHNNPQGIYDKNYIPLPYGPHPSHP